MGTGRGGLGRGKKAGIRGRGRCASRADGTEGAHRRRILRFSSILEAGLVRQDCEALESRFHHLRRRLVTPFFARLLYESAVIPRERQRWNNTSYQEVARSTPGGPVPRK